MKNLKNKIALVTGAASGIGRATSIAFAREGCDVVITDVNGEGLKPVAEEIKGLGRSALSVKADISNKNDVKILCEKALKEFGRVDVLINNAGVALYAEIKDTDLEDWEWIMGINLWGSIYTLNSLLPQMVENKCGHIVNVSSWAGLVGFGGNGAYCVTKFGVVGLSEVLRTEMERFNIGVTVVCPGAVQTNIFNSVKLKGFKKDIRKMPVFLSLTPEGMAKRIIRAVKRNKPQVITGVGKLGYLLKRISPAAGRFISRSGLVVFSKYKE